MSQSVYPPTVEGPTAHDDPIIGKPVAIGGRAQATLPTTVANGDAVRAWYTQSGHTMVASGEVATGIDGQTNSYVNTYSRTNGTAPLAVFPAVFNGTNWDRLRGTALGMDVSRAAAAATATLSNVAGSASSVTLLASNAARKGATIFNDSSALLYVKFGATASTTSHTVQVAAGGYFEVPFGYTGIMDGIWASATGNARVTELT